MHECTKAQNITKLPKNNHSCKGVGRTYPDPSHVEKIGDVEVPLGKPVNTDVKTDLLYNEYPFYYYFLKVHLNISKSFLNYLIDTLSMMSLRLTLSICASWNLSISIRFPLCSVNVTFVVFFSFMFCSLELFRKQNIKIHTCLTKTTVFY